MKTIMRSFLIMLSLAFLFSCNSEKKVDIKVQQELIEQAKNAFSELKFCLEKDDSKLWGNSLEGPVLLVDRDSRFIIANQKDKQEKLQEHEGVFVGVLPEDVIIANTAVEWNGTRWTMVALPLPEDLDESMNILTHESFHRIQPVLGFSSFDRKQPDHLDKKDGRILLKLEFEALKTALDAEIYSDEASIHIKNALKFRHYRHQLFPDAKKSENEMELLEGLAEFTSVTLSQIDTDAPHDYYMKKINELYNFPSFVKSFAYVTIPVYAHFLQQSDNKWNLKINRKTNLTDFISEEYGLIETDWDQFALQALGEFYRIKTITEFENKRALEKDELLTFYKHCFLSDSTLIIHLEKMSIGFDPTNMIPLEDHGTVYPTMRLTDNWGILEVDSLGALLSSDWKTVRLSYPISITDSLVKGKGWHLKLYEGWTVLKDGSKYSLKKG